MERHTIYTYTWKKQDMTHDMKNMYILYMSIYMYIYIYIFFFFGIQLFTMRYVSWKGSMLLKGSWLSLWWCCWQWRWWWWSWWWSTCFASKASFSVFLFLLYFWINKECDAPLHCTSTHLRIGNWQVPWVENIDQLGQYCKLSKLSNEVISGNHF